MDLTMDPKTDLRPTLLLTRPQADSLAFAQLMGVEAVISPLLAMQTTGPLPTLGAALIFTSANGVAAYVALGGPPGLPCWCVGPRTGRAAQEAGLPVQGIAPDSAALMDMEISAPSLTHLHGQHTRGNIASRLSARGLPCTSAAIYDQHAQPLTPEALGLLQSNQRVIVPLFSPRTATLFLVHCPQTAWPRLHIVAISQAVADALPSELRYSLALQPNGEAMQTAVRLALESLLAG